MPPILSLSLEDFQLLKEVLDIVRQRKQSRSKEAEPVLDYPAPEALLVQAISDMGQGVKECDVNQLIGEAPIRSDYTIDVYNPSGNYIPKGEYFPAIRDKYGSWLATSFYATSVQLNGTVVGTERTINLIEGADIALTAADNKDGKRIDVTIEAVGAGLTVEEADGVPSVIDVIAIIADQSTGLKVVDNGDDTITLQIVAASAIQMGAVTTGAQSIGGAKTFTSSVTVDGGGGQPAVNLQTTSTSAAYGGILYNANASVASSNIKVFITNTTNQFMNVFSLIPDSAGVGFHFSFAAYNNSAVAVNTVLALGKASGGVEVGASGTDALGNIFFGGMCKTVGGGSMSGYTDEQSQDAVGTILAHSDTIDFTYSDATPSITASVRYQMSITSDPGGIKLSGDSAAPGTTKYYGTDGSGTKGWFALPIATSYTDEQAQDAVGGILVDSTTIDFTYDDGANTITAIVKPASITVSQLAVDAVESQIIKNKAVIYAKIQDAGAGCAVLGRSANSVGVYAEITAANNSEVLLRRSNVLQFSALTPAELPGNNWIGNDNGSSLLASAFSLTHANGTWDDTGLSVTLPINGGKYRLTCRVRGAANASAGVGYLVYRLWNVTAGAAVSNSEVLGPVTYTVGTVAETHVEFTEYVTTGATNTVVRLEASRNSATTWTAATISSDANGRTKLSFERVV